MKNRIFNESFRAMCYSCSKFSRQHKTIIRFGLNVFLYKSLNVLNLSTAAKNLETNYAFFVKVACFLLIRETRRQWKIFKVDFVNVRQIWHSVNLFYCKTYTRGAVRTQLNINKEAFCWFSLRISTADVRLGSKYATAYVYIQVSPTEIICILSIFDAKYLTKEKWNKAVVSELKKKSTFHISLFVFTLYLSFPVTL